MGHPDSETRIGAHRVLSTVLMPSLIFPWLDQKELAVQSSLWPSSNLSALTTDSVSSIDGSVEKVQPTDSMKNSQRCNDVKQHRVYSSHSKSCSFKSAMTNGKMVRMLNSFHSLV